VWAVHRLTGWQLRIGDGSITVQEVQRICSTRTEGEEDNSATGSSHATQKEIEPELTD
jgi:hypothetical protein